MRLPTEGIGIATALVAVAVALSLLWLVEEHPDYPVHRLAVPRPFIRRVCKATVHSPIPAPNAVCPSSITALMRRASPLCRPPRP